MVLATLAVTSVGCYTEARVRDHGHYRVYEPAGASVEFQFRDGYYYRPHDSHRYYRHRDGHYYRYDDRHRH